MTRYRLTGGSVPFAGAQWERKDDDREIARRVLNLLADRRMLWKDFSLEIEEHCVTSANRAPDQTGVHLDNPEIGVNLARRLQLLQRLFRDFVDETDSERRLGEVDEVVLSLYARGLTTGEISVHSVGCLRRERLEDTVSRITDRVVERCRPGGRGRWRRPMPRPSSTRSW